MAGGIGSRFWPLSTQDFPKQFQDILGVGRTMIQQTYDRMVQIVPVENIYVITNKEYVDVTTEQLSDLPASNIVGEPMMKNTAACNMFMVNIIKDINPEARIIVTPADHLILKESKFLEKVTQAFEVVSQQDYLMTLGITPTRPDTGYGYIQFEENIDSNTEVLKVKTFTEKPNLELAKTFIDSGDFLWNAGIFIWSAKSITKAFKKYLPEMHQLFEECDYHAENTEPNCIEKIYPKVEKISIDNGILEKADNVYVIPADLGWSDLGTWNSVYENAEHDSQSNVIKSKHILTYNTKGSIVRVQDRKKVAIIDGLEDYIVIDTNEALLICPRANDQNIKNYVLDIKTKL